MAEGDAGLCGGFLKGVEIHNHHVDGLDAVRGDGCLVLRVSANVEQSAMHERMQCLYAAIEHFRKAGQIADVFDRKSRRAQCRRGAAGGNEFYAKVGQPLCEFDQSGLVGHAQQRPPNRLVRT